MCINTHSLLPAGFGIKQGAAQRSGLLEDTSKYEYIITTAKRGCSVGHIPREISRICSNVLHHHMTHPELQFKNSSMRCLNRLWLLFHSLCCTTRCIFESMLVHEPQVNTAVKCHINFILIEAWVFISYKWLLTQRLNESHIYSDPAFISYCSPVQSTMAGASIGVYEFGSVVRGQHIYKSESVWLIKLVSVYHVGKTTNMMNTL